ncbi:hypothetical protein BCF33_0955 [Hasllibacter halocynthiae]|uniref:Uncharacterized protein n=1 Tax=Hasllibacter halocynthiae TaxID=595589 RepID=A0A2T0X8U2_9RHOB|nr:hypothetical protein BCF33_0955 [Hasllibacter halocynthiae]
MWRLFKVLIVLAVLGIIALAAFAYLGDIEPEPRETRVPVLLEP